MAVGFLIHLLLNLEHGQQVSQGLQEEDEEWHCED